MFFRGHSVYIYFINHRIQFKIATLTYKTLATCQPSYLYNLLQVYHTLRALRSSTQQLFHVPYMSTDFGRCAFSYSSPATWNSIPISIKNCSSLYTQWTTKKRGSLFLTITLANLNRFLKFLYYSNREEILHATVVKFSTSP